MNKKATHIVVWTFVVVLFFWCVGFLGNHEQQIKSALDACVVKIKAGVSSWSERRERRKQERAEQIDKERQKQSEAAIESILKDFAMKESPILWKSVMQMRKDIAEQDMRIERLCKAFRDIGENPEADNDCTNLKRQREGMQGELDNVITALKLAYVESRKYEATLGQNKRTEFERNAKEKGLDEAAAAVRRYEEMRRQK